MDNNPIYKISLQDLKDKLSGRSPEQVSQLFAGVGVSTDPSDSVDAQCEKAHQAFQAKLSADPAPAPVLGVAPPSTAQAPAAEPMKAPKAPEHTHMIRAKTAKRFRAGRSWTSAYTSVHRNDFTDVQWKALESDKMIQIKSLVVVVI